MTDPASSTRAAAPDRVEDSTALRLALIQTARVTIERGLNVNKSGNVSARCVRGDAEGLLITPTSIAYQELGPEDLVFVNLQDGRCSGARTPSSEWRIHVDILRARREFGAIVHTHSPAATALSCHGLDLPAFHYMVAVCGGPDVRCAPYATFGTQALSDHALAALQGRKACLLRNHGALGCGADLADALAMAQELEHLAHTYLLARQLGEPLHLNEDEMQRVAEKFRTSYRQGG
jgi:L-fuculose-phosphate aldolase